MRELARRFVPAADEVYRLETEEGAEARFFREVAKNANTNPDDPTGSKQGFYACTPSGKLLLAINTTDREETVSFLEKALAAWQALSKEERLPKELPPREERPEDLYPEDGLALRIFARDLPARGRDTTLWNQDRVWVRASELRSFLPEKPEKGASFEAPLLARRLARAGFLDFVRGETESFEEKAVLEARLLFSVRSVEKGQATLELEGKTKTRAEGTWPVAGFEDMEKPTEQKRGLTLTLGGEAVLDLKSRRFLRFELVAKGTRFGGTQYNARAQDLAEAPIGFFATLAPEGDRIAPAFLASYGWR